MTALAEARERIAGDVGLVIVERHDSHHKLSLTVDQVEPRASFTQADCLTIPRLVSSFVIADISRTCEGIASSNPCVRVRLAGSRGLRKSMTISQNGLVRCSRYFVRACVVKGRMLIEARTISSMSRMLSSLSSGRRFLRSRSTSRRSTSVTASVMPCPRLRASSRASFGLGIFDAEGHLPSSWHSSFFLVDQKWFQSNYLTTYPCPLE